MTFKPFRLFYFILIICTCLWNQQASFISQKISIENSYQDKVTAAISRLLGRGNFIVIINLEVGKSQNQTSTLQSIKGSSNGYSPIPGLRLPTVPGSPPSTDEKYSLGRIEVIVNLNKELATGSIKQEIKSLIEKTIPETRDCEDCIKIESIEFPSSGKSNEILELKNEIAALQSDQRQAEENILKKELQDAEERLKEVQYEKEESEKIIKSRDVELERRETLEYGRLVEFEKSRNTQDSIRNVNTENELKQVRDNKMRSDSTLLSKTLGIVEKQIGNDKDEKEESLLGLQIGNGGSGIINSIILILLIICFLIITFLVARNKKPKSIYLKPKGAKTKNKAANSAGINDGNENNPPTEAPVSSTLKRNEDAIRSELRSLQKTAVSLSVGEKESASALIKEWLEDNPNKGENPAG